MNLANLKSFRKELDLSVDDLYRQKELIESCNDKFGGSISHSSKCNCNIHFPKICHMFSLGLSDDEVIEYGKKHNFTNIIFDVTVKRETNADIEDGLVLYFFQNETYPKHSGIFNKNWVESKWGGGHIWIHLPNECPLKYGEPKYYKKPSKQDIIQALKKDAARQSELI